VSVTVRPAAPADSRMVFEWRNDPVTMQASRSTGEVPWETHEAWYASVLAEPQRHLLVGEAPGPAAADEPAGYVPGSGHGSAAGHEAVGVVRFDAMPAGTPGPEAPPARWEVSINLAPTARGRGLSVPLLRAGAAWLADVEPAAEEIVAVVRTRNGPSQRAFASAGYVYQSTADGWDSLVLRLKE
jgi:UDP-2,4-diacetamido-2,4,6-trideoxy-beta-L-altropyranose hydrolase